jgi:hypothetical protein
MDAISHVVTDTPRREFYGYSTMTKGLKGWQTDMRNEAKELKTPRTGRQTTWWSVVTGSTTFQVEIQFDKTLATYCELMAAFAAPDQSPQGFAESFSKVEEAKATLCKTEGYGDLDRDYKLWLNRAKQGIKFGTVANLCVSTYGLGAAVTQNEETVALANSFYAPGSPVSGVRLSFSSFSLLADRNRCHVFLPMVGFTVAVTTDLVRMTLFC